MYTLAAIILIVFDTFEMSSRLSGLIKLPVF